MAYCESTDVKTGIPVPRGSSINEFVVNAAAEIDAELGQKYVVPIVLTLAATASGDRAYLKLINMSLATGRLILSAASGGEDSSLHAYGMYLVKEAYRRIEMLLSGAVQLENAEKLNPNNGKPIRGMLVLNEDPVALVGDFYNNAVPSTMPGYLSAGIAESFRNTGYYL